MSAYRDAASARRDLQPQRVRRVSAFFCRWFGHAWFELWHPEVVPLPRLCLRCRLREYNGTTGADFDHCLRRAAMILGGASFDASRD